MENGGSSHFQNEPMRYNQGAIPRKVALFETKNEKEGGCYNGFKEAGIPGKCEEVNRHILELQEFASGFKSNSAHEAGNGLSDATCMAVK